MAVERLISTLTTVTTHGGDIIIFTKYYEDSNINTIFASILDAQTIQDQTPGIECELLIQMRNYPDQIDFTIDDHGNLIVLSTTGDVDNYSINENGELAWTGEVN
jgi:hypothetical protein